MPQALLPASSETPFFDPAVHLLNFRIASTYVRAGIASTGTSPPNIYRARICCVGDSTTSGVQTWFPNTDSYISTISYPARLAEGINRRSWFGMSAQQDNWNASYGDGIHADDLRVALLAGGVAQTLPAGYQTQSVAGTATISGTVLTVVSSTGISGVFGPNLAIAGTGFTAGTVIGTNISGSGVGSTWNVSPSQTVSTPTAFTSNWTFWWSVVGFGGGIALAANPNGTGCGISFSPNAAATYDHVDIQFLDTLAAATGTGSITGTTFTATTVSGTITVGMGLAGANYAAGTYITGNISGSGAGSTWTVSVSQTVAASSAWSQSVCYFTVNGGAAFGSVIPTNSGIYKKYTIALPASTSVTNITAYFTVYNHGFQGMALWNSVSPSVEIYNGGIAGLLASSLPGNVSVYPFYNQLQSLLAIQPHLTIIKIGNNDLSNGFNPVTTATYVEAFAQQVQAIGSDVIIVVPEPFGYSAYTTVIAQYRAALLAICQRNGFGMIDNSAKYGNSYLGLEANTYPLLNGLHPTIPLYWSYGDWFANLICSD
jgi:hypothetical protein